jgi:putative phage-type endonuclease
VKILNDFSQGSEEWNQARRWRATASHASEVITPAKGELSKSAQKYIFSLIAECGWSGDEIPEFQTYAMKRGSEMEPIAREAFEAETGLKVSEVGLCVADDNICACSPDGLILDAGNPVSGVEIKCPLKETHAEYVLNGVLPDAYKSQIHWSLAVTGLDTWHFWSFHPCYKPLHLVVQRDAFTTKVEAAMVEFMKLYRESHAKAVKSLFIPADYLEEN